MCPSNIELRAGDLFLTRSDQFFGKLIRIRGRIESPDGENEYNHAGILTSSYGDTFESRRKIDNYNIFDEYIGSRILIVRPDDVPETKVYDAIDFLENKYKGKTYPWWRIIAHSISPYWARKLHASGIPVCSELDAYYLHLIERRHDKCFGTTPAILEDEFKEHRGYTIIFEGVCPEGIEQWPVVTTNQ